MTPEQQVELILGTLFPDAFIADRSGPARRDEALTLIASLLAEERRAGAEQALREIADELDAMSGWRSALARQEPYITAGTLRDRADQIAQGQP